VGEFSAPWRAVLASVLLAAVLTVTVALPIASAWRALPVRVDALNPVALFTGQGILAAFLAIWFALQDRMTARQFFHLPRGRVVPRIASGLLVGAIGWLVTIAAMGVLGVVTRGAHIEPQHGFVDVVIWLATRPAPLRVALIAVAMTVEEAFFRAFLQPRFGILTATLCFALAHVNYGSPIMGGGVLVIGSVLGWTFLRRDDLLVCVVAHGVFDAIQLLIVLPLIAARL
jgi:membrane protease YdiL (CAAX protease family)